MIGEHLEEDPTGVVVDLDEHGRRVASEERDDVFEDDVVHRRRDVGPARADGVELEELRALDPVG